MVLETMVCRSALYICGGAHFGGRHVRSCIFPEVPVDVAGTLTYDT